MTVHYKVYGAIESQALNLYLERCGLTLIELETIIAQAETLEAELRRVYAEAAQALDGQSYMVGFAGPEFATLQDLTTHDFWLTSSFRLGHEFPVKTWQKILTKQKKHIERVQGQIERCKCSDHYADPSRDYTYVYSDPGGQIVIQVYDQNRVISLRMSQDQARQVIAAIQSELR